MQKRLFALASVLLMISLISGVDSYWGPRVFMQEQVTGHYNTSGLDGASGTPESYDSRGWMGVLLPNTDDVLQSVRINLSEDALLRTNIRNKDNITQAFRDYAISYPTLNDSTLMYFNTTDSQAALYYRPVYNYTPALNMSVIITNARGGNDLYSRNNLATPVNLMRMNFTLRNDAPAGMKDYAENNITLVLTFNRNSYLLASASIDNGSVSTDNGYAYSLDAGAASDHDKIIWEGTLAAGESAHIWFDTNITSLQNYLGKNNNLNGETSTIGAHVTYAENDSLFSGTTMTDAYARGPIREGVELYRTYTWDAKVYIKNMANSSVAPGEHNLTYNITSWRIYNASETTGEIVSLLSSNDSLNLLLNPGDMYVTPEWVRTARIKPYIAPYFDWYVLFNSTGTFTYSSTLDMTLELPTLHELDIVSSKDTSNQLLAYVIDMNVLSMNITAIHAGSTSDDTRTGRMNIFSTIPYTDIDNQSFANLTINTSTLRLYFINSTDTVELDLADPDIDYTIVQSTNTTNGSITLDIYDLSNVSIRGSSAEFGRNLTTLDRIILSFDLKASRNYPWNNYSGLENGEIFIFDGNMTFWTSSGTPLTVSSFVSKMSTENILEGYKQLTSPDSSQPEIVEVNIRLDILGTVREIKFRDYVPYGATNVTSLTMSFGGTPWYENIHYNRTYLGTTLTSDGANVTVWEYTNVSPSSDGWDITDNWLSLTYRMNVSLGGAYILPLQIAGFDPGAERGIEMTRYGLIGVSSLEKLRPMITRDDGVFYPSGIFTVDTPSVYHKSFTIYNPNDHPAKSAFSTELYPDYRDASLVYYTIYGKKMTETPNSVHEPDRAYITWESILGPFESRTYDVSFTAPPVIMLSRKTCILEKVENKNVLLETEFILKNNALEDCPLVRLPLDIKSEKIRSVMDSTGSYIDYGTDEETGYAYIDIRDIPENDLKTLYVQYTESYPSLSLTVDNPRYDSGSRVSLSLDVINGAETIGDPSFELEIYTENDELIYADLINFDSMDSLEEVKKDIDWVIPTRAPTGRYVAYLKFKEDMSEIAASSTTFYVLGGNSSGYFGVILILLIISFFGISYSKSLNDDIVLDK